MFEVKLEVPKESTHFPVIESNIHTHRSSRIPNDSDEDLLKVNNHQIALNQSIKLHYHVRNLFESSMIKFANNYQIDHKFFLKIRKQKITVGLHENYTHKNSSI